MIDGDYHLVYLGDYHPQQTATKSEKMKLAGAYIPEDKHAALRALAKKNHRTLADQLRHMFDEALSGRLTVPKFVSQKKGGKR
jgi:hypothetical protein